MDELTLSIGDLARRTGVDIPTLRRWERYEGLLTPTRTPGGQRRYGTEDVAAVQELVSLIEKGWAPASAARAVAEHRDTGAIVFDTSLLDAVPTGVIVTNVETQVLYANPAIASMLGVTPAELEAAGGADFLEEDERVHVLEAFKEMRRGVPQRYDVRMTTRSGEHVDVEVAAGPLLGPSGQYRGVVGVFQDLARLRTAQRRSTLLSQLVDAAQDSVVAVDGDGVVLAWNATAAATLDGIAEGRSLTDLVPEPLGPPMLAAVRRAFDGEPSTFELRAPDDGEDDGLAKQVRAVPLLDPDGRPAGATVVLIDVVPSPEVPDGVGASTAYHGVVAALTQSVLNGEPAAAVVETAVRGIARALEATHVAFIEVLRPSASLAIVASTADEPGTSHAATEPFGSHVAFAVQSQRPIVVQDFDTERRFDRGPFAGEQAARSGLCVPVRWRPLGEGALCVHSAEARRDLGPIEVTFVQSAANVCALALQGREATTTEERP
jgi:PAS domain S-box-containing protein